MGRWRVGPLVAVLVVIAATMAACASSAKKAAVPTTTAAPVASTAAPQLTASFRGVTATSIRVGIVTIDYTCIKQFVDYNFGNEPAIAQVLIDDLNAHGGILGRKIDPVYKSYCPIGSTAALAACTSLTEDDHVFAVLGLLYDNTGDADLCLSRDHQTVYIGFQLTQQTIGQAPPGLMLSTDVTPERRSAVLLNLLAAQGTLTGRKVATFTDADTTAVGKVVKPALDRMGVAQGSAAVVTIVGSDTSAAQAQLESFIEKWKGEGVNTIILSGNFVTAKQFVEKIKAAMPGALLITDGEASAQGGGQDETTAGTKPNPYDGLLTASGLSDLAVWQSAPIQQCVRTYEARSGQQVIGPDQLKPGPDGKLVQVWQSVRDFCGYLAMLSQIADKAGPDLTNTTWSQAADAFGAITLPSSVYASVHRGKYDADDGFRLVAFDSTIGNKGDYRPVTPIEDASR